MKSGTYVGNVTIIIDKYGGILLGKKKRKNKPGRIGMGMWVPPGGKTIRKDKSQRHSAQREVREETGLKLPLLAFEEMGVLEGFLKGSQKPTWTVHLYRVFCFKANQIHFNPKEFDDMQWFLPKEIPWKHMLPGDRKWLLRIAEGEKLSIKRVAYRKIGGRARMVIRRI